MTWVHIVLLSIAYLAIGAIAVYLSYHRDISNREKRNKDTQERWFSGLSSSEKEKLLALDAIARKEIFDENACLLIFWLPLLFILSVAFLVAKLFSTPAKIYDSVTRKMFGIK